MGRSTALIPRSPWVRDVTERATSTVIGGGTSYFAEYMIEEQVGLVHLAVELKGMLFALGAGLFAFVKGYVARWFGRKGTASLTGVVAYAPNGIFADCEAD